MKLKFLLVRNYCVCKQCDQIKELKLAEFSPNVAQKVATSYYIQIETTKTFQKWPNLVTLFVSYPLLKGKASSFLSGPFKDNKEERNLKYSFVFQL